MIAGFTLDSNLNIDLLLEKHIRWIEIPYCMLSQKNIISRLKQCDIQVSSILITWQQLMECSLQQLLDDRKLLNANYIVVSTEELSDLDRFKDKLIELAGLQQGTAISILIENGYTTVHSYIKRGILSEAGAVAGVIDECNDELGGVRIGACYNIGHANVLGINLCEMSVQLGERIQLIHVNDNDGRSDLHQLPYSFTTGRSDMSTDWYRAVAGMLKIGYDGVLMFDCIGVFESMPSFLHDSVISLINAIVGEWNRAGDVLNKLMQTDKKRILFGAGGMFEIYMKDWQGKCQPDFIVDNDRNKWGTTKLGIEIKSPQDILAIPEQERNVFICSLYYDEIERQLADMGIKAERYYEFYYE